MAPSTAARRSALAALDNVRPVIARLDISRDPEDIAADVIEAWNGTETALRSLAGGSSLSGQALIAELRRRELLGYEDAHSLLDFLSARDRVQRTEYRPTSADINAAREGVARLEQGLMNEPIPPMPGGAAAAASASPAPAATEPASEGRGVPSWLVVALILLVVIGLAAGAWMFAGREPAEVQKGADAYAAGRREEAAGYFTKAARDNPKMALPHIYLSRISRENGDAAGALREAQAAVTAEPQNALAWRELAAHHLAAGNLDLARRFYTRALTLDPNDHNAQGYLGCTLVRLGRLDEARRWIDRAGRGEWSSCTPPAGVAPVAPGPTGAVRTP